MKPQSYPFLAIAKRYHLDYGDVLMVADHWRRNLQGTESERTTPSLHNALLWPHEALGEITFANSDFRAIQAGRIDWNTGEPVNLKNETFAQMYGKPRYGGTLKDFQAQGRALRPIPKGALEPEPYDLSRFKPGPVCVSCNGKGWVRNAEKGEHMLTCPGCAGAGSGIGQ